ncbi:type II secretion system protein [Candidatus Sumerlaeota bacterium]|nr:type II secretion system protein [Candidatus Sumerlaeota bacterium]MBI3736086.1 type II secretion system protein [Candidatus Sumerlaeota bacterium]
MSEKRVRPRGLKRANTFVEILIVLAVTALLALIATINYGGRSKAAQQARASAEIEALAQAEQAAADAYGVYVPLQTLDDLPSGRENESDRRDLFSNEPKSLMAIDVIGSDASAPPAQKPLSERIAEWKGPYFSSKRVYVGGTLQNIPSVASLPPAMIHRDYPLDPWGNAYRLYSPLGVVGGGAAKLDAAALDSDTFSDGVLTGEDRRFNRFAIVSYGPDGKSDSVSNGNDDLIYFFGPGEAKDLPAGAK